MSRVAGPACEGRTRRDWRIIALDNMVWSSASMRKSENEMSHSIISNKQRVNGRQMRMRKTARSEPLDLTSEDGDVSEVYDTQLQSRLSAYQIVQEGAVKGDGREEGIWDSSVLYASAKESVGPQRW